MVVFADKSREAELIEIWKQSFGDSEEYIRMFFAWNLVLFGIVRKQHAACHFHHAREHVQTKTVIKLRTRHKVQRIPRNFVYNCFGGRVILLLAKFKCPCDAVLVIQPRAHGQQMAQRNGFVDRLFVAAFVKRKGVFKRGNIF